MLKKLSDLKKILHLLSAIWTIPFGLLIFAISPLIIHYYDVTAETMTIGQLQKLAFVCSSVCWLDGISWLMIYLTFPSWFKFYKSLFLKRVEPKSKQEAEDIWKQRVHLHFIYFAYFFAGVLLTFAAAI